MSVRFLLRETSLCFVCSHLASGGREGDKRHRNSDATEILLRTTFPHGPSHNLPRKILDHEYVARLIILPTLTHYLSLSCIAAYFLFDVCLWSSRYQGSYTSRNMHIWSHDIFKNDPSSIFVFFQICKWCKQKFFCYSSILLSIQPLFFLVGGINMNKK